MIFTKQAGLSNPTEGGAYLLDRQHHQRRDTVSRKRTTRMRRKCAKPSARRRKGLTPDNTQEDIVTGLLVDWEVQLSHEGVRRGDEVTVIGRGYKNGTTLTFWRDANFDGRRDSGENELCRVEVGGNDIGVVLLHWSATRPSSPASATVHSKAADGTPAGTDLQLCQRRGRPEPTLNPGPRYRDNRDRGRGQCRGGRPSAGIGGRSAGRPRHQSRSDNTGSAYRLPGWEN